MSREEIPFVGYASGIEKPFSEWTAEDRARWNEYYAGIRATTLFLTPVLTPLKNATPRTTSVPGETSAERYKRLTGGPGKQ